MNLDVSRRTFVESMAAGLPLAASAALADTAQDPLHGHQSADDQASRNAMLEHLLSQLVLAHNQAKANGLSGETGRRAAAALRTMSVYAAQIGFDAQVKQAVGRHVARQGRDTVLYAEPNTAAMRDELRRLGAVPGTVEFGRFGPPDDATRRRALDGLTQGSIASRFEVLARDIERLAAESDRRVGPLPALRRVQYTYGGFDCASMSSQIGYLEAEVAIACGAASFFPALASVCGALSITLGIELLAFNYWC